MQINEDESRELLSRGEEESGKDPDTEGIPKAVSASVSVCASGIESLSKEKTPAIDEAKTDVTEKVQNHYEKHPIQASLSDCHNNAERDEDFTAKDLLGFAWQVARGMVSYVSVITLLFSVNGVFRKHCEGYNSSCFFVEGGGGERRLRMHNVATQLIESIIPQMFGLLDKNGLNTYDTDY